MLYGRVIYQSKYRWPRCGNGQTDFGLDRQTFKRVSRELRFNPSLNPSRYLQEITLNENC